MTATATPVHSSALQHADASAVAGALRRLPHLVLHAETATRSVTALAARTGDGFAMLTPRRGRTPLLTRGPGDRLSRELARVVPALQCLVGAVGAVAGRASPPVAEEKLGAGDLLALAELVRRGDQRRLDVACADLGIRGLPWWITDFAWGAQAQLAIALVIDGECRACASMQLLEHGWGCLHADDAGDIGFAALTPERVQARVGTFVRLLMGAADA
ncbi:hypothetical protein HJ588_05150 [Flexivirga sp. ID2601S]|uniref:Uncharacterized protein n=1 Tax=Flexivirga aerilata TaxID=1656889 RepID=A0A849AFP2_9MICO|nr:hypothetical protein [Flexivirga aerilata]NNG38663.1 hypothetical protein [Flexivirga aerilata]